MRNTLLTLANAPTTGLRIEARARAGQETRAPANQQHGKPQACGTSCFPLAPFSGAFWAPPRLSVLKVFDPAWLFGCLAARLVG